MTAKRSPETRWVRFWRKFRTGRTIDTYVRLSHIGFGDKTALKNAAEDWADEQGAPGYDFEYGFEIVDQPPEEWIDKEIAHQQRILIAAREEIDNLMKLVNGGKT